MISELVSKANEYKDQEEKLRVKRNNLDRLIAKKLGVCEAMTLMNNLVYVKGKLPDMDCRRTIDADGKPMLYYSRTIDGIEFFYTEVIE